MVILLKENMAYGGGDCEPKQMWVLEEEEEEWERRTIQVRGNGDSIDKGI